MLLRWICNNGPVVPPVPHRTPPPPTAAVHVEVVHLALAALAAPGLGWSVTGHPLDPGRDPDSVARSCVDHAAAVLAVHSTSWRWQPPSTLVLTYAALLAHTDLELHPLEDPVILTSGDPLRPRPTDLHDHHVVAHAVWHLAVLAERDPVFARLATHPQHRQLFDALRAAARQTPTTTFEQAHPGATAPAELTG